MVSEKFISNQKRKYLDFSDFEFPFSSRLSLKPSIFKLVNLIQPCCFFFLWFLLSTFSDIQLISWLKDKCPAQKNMLTTTNRNDTQFFFFGFDLNKCSLSKCQLLEIAYNKHFINHKNHGITKGEAEREREWKISHEVFH